MKLQAIDLNLLVALDALLSESTVTAAARRLGRSQSATSHALGRLRELLGDRLLERTPEGMLPTPRARELATEVRRLLAQVENVLTPPRVFDPASSDAVFSVGLDDATQAGLLPPFMARMKREAPGIQVHADGSEVGLPAQDLARGRLDVAIKVCARVPDGFHAEHVATATYVTVARKGHPLLRRRLDLAAFARLDHVVCCRPPLLDQEIDRHLAAHALQRRHAVTASSFLSIPWIVARSDLVATLPDHFVDVVRRALPLVAYKPPVPLEEIRVQMIWHDRTDQDPAQRWFREALRSFMRPVRPGRQPARPPRRP